MMFKSKFNMGRLVAAAGFGMALLATNAAVAGVSTYSVLEGWVSSVGGSDEAAPQNNTFTGSENGQRYNSWASFYIPAGNYQSATLTLTPGSYGDLGPAVIGLFDVAAPMSAFQNTFHPGVDIFNDLGSGREYASASFYDQPLSITLNGRALADINAAGGGYFLIGFTNKTLNAQPIRSESVLGSGIYISGNGRNQTRMELDLGLAPVPEPATWMTLGAGLLLLGAVVRRRQRPSVKRALAALALGAGVAALPAAHAGTLDFDSVDPAFIWDGDSVRSGGYAFTGAFVGDPSDGGGLVGAVIDGSDPFLCANMACPSNNGSHYLAGLNDGMLNMSSATAGQTFHLGSFDASFIGHDFLGSPEVSGVLWLTGTRADGSTLEEYFALAKPDFGFQHYRTSGAFGASEFVSISIASFSCDFDGECNAFNSNQAQFALDNVSDSVAAVPEPSTYAMLGLGLALIGSVARRRAA
jgi:hypothetical protein